MAHIFPIGGGKGGSGKSFILANLGVLLAKRGKRVVLVDLDLGGANLHTFLGLKNPKTGLNDFLNLTFNDLSEVSVPTGVPNLFLISSVNCPPEITNLFYLQKLKIIKAIKALSYDYILLDLGAGSNFNILDFFLTSNEGIFVLTPEPTSIENIFHFIKAVYVRNIKQILKQNALNWLANEIQDNIQNGAMRSPQHFIEMITKNDPVIGALLEKLLNKFNFKLILNQFRKQTDEMLGYKIEKVCNKHFFSNFQFLGNIGWDERVHDSISVRKTYVTKYSYSTTAIDLQKIANRIENDSRGSKLPSLERS